MSRFFFVQFDLDSSDPYLIGTNPWYIVVRIGKLSSNSKRGVFHCS